MSKYKKVKRLFSFNNLKIKKSLKYGYEGVILHLAPFDLSGWNICPLASKGCIKGCLNTSGLGQLNSVQLARINKTYYLRYDRQIFLEQLDREIANGIIRAKKKNKKFCVLYHGRNLKLEIIKLYLNYILMCRFMIIQKTITDLKTKCLKIIT
jgi:hypothetical protein